MKRERDLKPSNVPARSRLTVRGATPAIATPASCIECRRRGYHLARCSRGKATR